MSSTNKKYNSINDVGAQMMRNNQNTLEILSKIDQALNNNDSYVNAKTIDAAGVETVTQIPTLGYIKQKLDQLFKMVRILSGVDGNPSSIQVADNIFKRIIVADLNLEPKAIPALAPVTVFKTDPNHFFDAFLNPKISIQLNLTDKISLDTRVIESRRFIVEFEKILTILPNGDEQLELTTLGAARKLEFEQKYKGKSNIDMIEFVTWLDTQGLVNRVDDTLVDQEYFPIDPNRLQKKGNFTVLNTDIDTENKKLWYVLDTLTYYDISDLLNAPKPIQLKVGDFVNVNPNDVNVKSTTVYKVVEISTITSEFRVRFETVYGEEPISIRLAALSIYSDVIKNRTAKISVGFDEYCVVFIRQIDSINNLVGLDWSPGVGFWTSELRLDNNNGELFSDYYVKTVYDYGLILEDLVAKKVPNYYGVKPNAPVLNTNNFKVVQINAHLTQTVDAEAIRDLHNQKNNLTSEITQIQSAIEKQNKIIQTTSFISTADRKRADDELSLLTTKLNTKSQTKFSVVQDILASKKNLNKIAPIYHVRGFFPMPQATDSTKTAPQEVVQFEVWYRKTSKSGTENEILTISDLDNSASRLSSSTNTTSQNNISQPKTVNGAFSNWVKIKTDSRKRSQDPNTGDWFWHIEDVSDANTPNINQIDIMIEPGEMIELKIKSLSEVGWPETPVESDFSNAINILFPDDLNSVLNEDEFILQEAQSEDIKVKFESVLDSRGLGIHLNSAYRLGDIYYAHRAQSIDSGFKDTNNNVINLYDQLLAMVSKITSLEETINRAKGVSEIYLDDNGNRIRLFNGNNLTFNINLEDYITPTQIGVQGFGIDSTSRTYENKLTIINRYKLLIKNSSESAQVGLLSYRGYGDASGLSPFTMAYDGKYRSGTNRGIQALWTTSDSTILTTSPTVDENNAGVLSVIQTPKYRATQKNNQWLWLVTKDLNGNYIYDSDQAQNSSANTANQSTNNDLWQFTTAALLNNGSKIHNTLTKRDTNLGFLTGSTQGSPVLVDNITQITDSLNWSVSEAYTSIIGTNGYMASTIAPVVSSFTDIVDTSTQLIKFLKAGETNLISIPLNIYVKPYTGTLVKSPAGGGLVFNDSAYTTVVGGDMPTVDPANTLQRNGNNTRIFFLTNADRDVFNQFDRVVFSGFTNANLNTTTNNFNNKVLTVLEKGGGANNYIDVNYNPGLSLSNVTPVADGGGVVVQVHKKYSRTAVPSGVGLPASLASEYTGVGAELEAYNVLGRVGSDNRIVDNYIEIKTRSATPSPAKHTKKLRFVFEEETSIRPFDFQLNWNITQYKPVQIQTSLGNNSLNNNGTA